MPYVKRKSEILRPTTITPATGWVANVTGERGRPLVGWALLPDGEITGLVYDGFDFVPAENVLNFTGYQRVQ
jgi:hypothetical protein